jgi:transcriptional regulator with XRE-family HTH domain
VAVLVQNSRTGLYAQRVLSDTSFEGTAALRGRRMVGKRHRLASTRKAAGFSQERLAETVGVDRSTVMRWERGETRPQPWARPKLARALGISDQALSELLGDSAEPESATSAPGPIVGEVASLHRRNVLKQKIAPSGLDSPPDSVSDDEGSHELVALLNGLTAHRLPLLDDRYAKGVGVSVLEDASLAERAKIILRLFLQLDDELGGPSSGWPGCLWTAEPNDWMASAGR